MTWLLKLYPRRWRDRYGEEFVALLRDQRWSFGLLVDVVAGAVDARIAPQRPAGAPHDVIQEGDVGMFARALKFKCAGYDPSLTPRDRRTSAAIQLGGTLALALVWMWLRVTYRGNPYIDACLFLTFLGPYVLSMPFNSLKGRSRETQAIIMGGTLAILVAIALGAGFVAARL
jgi:hypothetical protein